MVEAVQDRATQSFDVGKINDPAHSFLHWPIDKNGDVKGVPVQSPTLVSFGNMRESMSRLKREFFVNLHA